MNSDPPVVHRGVWVAYYSDRSGIAAFDSEIEALRYAVKHTCLVEFREFGEDLFSGEAYDA